MEFADLSLRKRDDHHAGEPQVLVERRHVRLVAAHPVEGLRNQDLERPTPCLLQQRLDAGPQDHAVAGDRGVLVGTRDLPALARRALTADPELVLDGCRSLLVGRVTGIERAAKREELAGSEREALFERAAEDASAVQIRVLGTDQSEEES